MATEPEYVLTSDDDGHWYVCPADREEEFHGILAAIGEYWEPGSDHEGEPPQIPNWVREVGGSPSLVRFRQWRIEGDE